MVWQCILALLILRRELGSLRWSVLAPRIWAQTPRDPASGLPRRRLWWWIVPAIIGVGLFGDALGDLIDAPMGWLGLHAPENTELQDLATDAFVGAWWLLPIALVSGAFNYMLGEELLWRGVLLPKMRGAFGRWDWLVNALLFTFYHLHKPWTWPSSFIGNVLIAYPARRFRSTWLAVAIHGVEGLIMLLLITGVILGFAAE
jgi:membrane protease YdiL (CAAX protease family)